MEQRELKFKQEMFLRWLLYHKENDTSFQFRKLIERIIEDGVYEYGKLMTSELNNLRCVYIDDFNNYLLKNSIV